MINLLLQSKLTAYVAVFVLLASLFGYQNFKIKRLSKTLLIIKEDNNNLKQSIEVQKETMSSLENGLTDVIKNNNMLTQKLSSLNKEHQEKRAKLNSYRGRLNEVAKKNPKDIELRINNSTNQFLQRLEEATNNSK